MIKLRTDSLRQRDHKKMVGSSGNEDRFSKENSPGSGGILSFQARQHGPKFVNERLEIDLSKPSKVQR